MTLYRKYRPKTFQEVAGRDSIKKVLTEELKTGRIAHAYLFSGTRGTGKTTIARLLAKALNCKMMDKKTGEPCNKCLSCVSINEGRSQDLIEIDAASNRRIEEIRELRESVKYVPSSALYKVYIVDEVHMLTPEAFNALLKTLEEPPAHAVFILATTELHKIPETIFSRCQHFSFSRLSVPDVINRLNYITEQEGADVSEDVIADIARRCGGSFRDAESLLGQILSIGKKSITPEDAAMFLPKVGFKRTIDWISRLISRDAQGALKILEDLEEEGINLIFFVSESIETARQIMIYAATSDEDRLKMYFTPDEVREIKQIALNANPSRAREVVVELLRASQDMKLSPNIPSLPVEIAVVMVCCLENQHKEEPSDLSSSSKILQQEPKKEDIKKETEHRLEDILDGWGEVLAKVKDKNHALNFVLGVAQPVAVNGSTLELGFKYRLQQEKISEIKNRQIVENIIKEVYGADYHIEPVLKEDIVANNGSFLSGKQEEKEDKFVKAALRVFEGAQIIN